MTYEQEALKWLTNLQLADNLARAYGMHRAAAIKRCARRMRDKAVTPRIKALARQILEAPDPVVVRMVGGLFEKMIEEDVLVQERKQNKVNQ